MQRLKSNITGRRGEGGRGREGGKGKRRKEGEGGDHIQMIARYASTT